MEIIALLAVVTGLIFFHYCSVKYGRKCDQQMGVNIGEKHLKETWGIDDNKLYHE